MTILVHSPVVDHLHVSILLDPQLAYDDVVDAAGGVSPGVGLVVPEQPGPRDSTHVSIEIGARPQPPLTLAPRIIHM